MLQSPLFKFWIISAISFYLVYAEDKPRKKIGTPNCLTIANALDLNFFQYPEAPFTKFVNNGLTIWGYYRKASWKLAFLISLPLGWIQKPCALLYLFVPENSHYHILGEKNIICIWSKFLTTMQKPLVKILPQR